MAGLVPVKRSREEIHRANSDLVEKHRVYLASWVSEKSSHSQSKSGSAADQPRDAKAGKVSSGR